MNQSQDIKEIAAALAKAQANIGPAIKGAKNPFFKSRYADLSAIMEVCKQPLLDEGITVLQMVGHSVSSGAMETRHTPYLETILLHTSGQFISDKMYLVCAKPNDPQAMGSAITYARRYALQAALFIPTEDDDAESAMSRPQKNPYP